MKKYYNPEIELIVLANEDILTLSAQSSAFGMGEGADELVWEW